MANLYKIIRRTRRTKMGGGIIQLAIAVTFACCDIIV